jgi:hypothetical protein
MIWGFVVLVEKKTKSLSYQTRYMNEIKASCVKIRASMLFEMFAYCMIDIASYGINIKYENVRKNKI